jgi:hypothetical protein
MPNEVFVYDVRFEDVLSSTSITCAYVGNQARPASRLADALKLHFENHLPTQALLLFALSSERDDALSLAKAEVVNDRLPIQMRDGAIVALLTANGKFTVVEPTNSVLSEFSTVKWCTEPRLAFALSTGLIKISQRRPPILKAERGFHYVKPSKKHTEYFIRGANLLVNGAEIDFIAFCAAQHVRHVPSCICTDTGAINSLAYALLRLIETMFPGEPPPSIDSFGSYGNVDEYSFPPNSLILMSASTSMGLVKRIKRRRREVPAVLITLIGPGSPASEDEPVLLKMTDLGVPDILNYDDEDCGLCRVGSTPIHIRDEHFLPTTPNTRSELLLSTIGKAWLPDVCARLVGNRAVRVYPDGGLRESTPNLFIDVEKLVDQSSSDYYKQSLDKLIEHKFPASASTIIYLDDRASEVIAKRCQELAQRYAGGTRSVRLLPASMLSQPETIQSLTGTIVVVSGVVNTGASFAKVSLMLRGATSKAGIWYLSLFSRTETEIQLKRVVSDLTFGERPGEFGFNQADKVYLPATTSRTWTSWQKEAHLLRAFLDANSSCTDPAMSWIGKRLDDLTLRGQNGLVDELFWWNPAGETLKIRHGFAFWPADPNLVQHATQADVFFTITAVLHEARIGVDASAAKDSGKPLGLRPWMQSEHQRVVIAPSNFARYSDGVIQASILRAAEPRELDYSYSEEHSRTFAQIAIQIVRERNRQTGEAANEILVALALKKVQLVASTMVEVCKSLEEMLKSGLPKDESVRALFALVRHSRKSE